MPFRFAPLPDMLLRNLGRYSRQEALQQALMSLHPPVRDLRQGHGTDPYHVGVESLGLDLMLQCMDPGLPDQGRLWGLHALTFHAPLSRPANPWKGEWPQGLDAATATSRDIVALLADQDDEAVLELPTMACFLAPGFDGQTWAVQCAFGGPAKTLKTLSLVRTGDWVGASWLPAGHARSAHPDGAMP
ncbi:hypothetical protein [Acidovorax sp. NCPPB 4044]|uniref:hypothetical protein n=1 Tax=Acidovorax sp. NCPPB 4044 TaxID=2940490 RepID=UPI002304849B|nr:hypothetical protein [Acidovorax sp. NCPPB 4044]MDA8522639.1 hypothetical protein [Acidovorax sp. NCPPB 4044]